MNGSGPVRNHDIRYWGAVIRQALIMGLIDKNIENYGLLSINAKGEEFIAAPRPVYNSRPRLRRGGERDRCGGSYG